MWQSRSLCLWLMLPMANLVAGTETAVNPVEQVITLLKDVRDQIQEEGKQEAISYDKFACFCKEEADEKMFVIKKSAKQIDTMIAEIKVLKSDISELDDAVAEDREKREGLEEEGKDALAKREKQFKEYAGEEKDAAAAIKAIEGAIEALEISKGSMSEGTKLNLMTSKKALHKFADSGKPGLATTAIREVLALLEEDPGAYEFASNDIISTLKGLLKTFKKDKVELDSEEAGKRNSYEMEAQARDFKIKKLGEMIEQNTAMSAEKTQKKSETEELLAEEEKMKKQDSAFLKELTKLCEDKAGAWDERSKARASEITAITEALGDLESGVQKNYGANKKLTLLVAKHPAISKVDSINDGEQLEDEADATTDELDDIEDGDDDAVSFMQLRGAKAPKHTAAARRKAKRAAIDYLMKRATDLKSKRLSTIAAKLKVGKDYFVKVRGIIKDLIKKLEADAKAEATQKDFCDEEMTKATDKRDEEIGNIEASTASIDETKSKITNLKENIVNLENEIADLFRQKKEIEDLRAEEKAENEKTIKEAEEGGKAVANAIKVLKAFYEKGGFLQTSFEPTGGDRDGNTVADLAPDSGFEGEYRGGKASADGIFGLLEIIQSDFERTAKAVTKAEKKAVEDFKKQKKEIEEDIKTKKGEVKDFKSDLESEESNLVGHKEDLKDAKTALEDVKGELAKLKPLCVDTGMSWKARRAQQKEEIEALKEALTILEDWQSA